MPRQWIVLPRHKFERKLGGEYRIVNGENKEIKIV